MSAAACRQKSFKGHTILAMRIIVSPISPSARHKYENPTSTHFHLSVPWPLIRRFYGEMQHVKTTHNPYVRTFTLNLS
jgi:hypothetical protein